MTSPADESSSHSNSVSTTPHKPRSGKPVMEHRERASPSMPTFRTSDKKSRELEKEEELFMNSSYTLSIITIHCSATGRT